MEGANGGSVGLDNQHLKYYYFAINALLDYVILSSTDLISMILHYIHKSVSCLNTVFDVCVWSTDLIKYLYILLYNVVVMKIKQKNTFSLGKLLIIKKNVPKNDFKRKIRATTIKAEKIISQNFMLNMSKCFCRDAATHFFFIITSQARQ